MAPKSQQIYINIPISAMEPAIAFYTAIGFMSNPKFANPMTTMMVLSSAINVMLITPARFAECIPAGRTISDSKKAIDVLFCLSADSKEAVDDMVAKAAGAGGKADVTAKEELGDFMYIRSFEDLDGHVWKVMWMNDEGC